jgi:STELLO glycosyltransferases
MENTVRASAGSINLYEAAMKSTRWIVVTTIQLPTEALQRISAMCSRGWSAVVIGDTKTPAGWAAPGIEYLPVEAQIDLFGDIAREIPVRHYARKNLGYLYAIKQGADLILETDDDNLSRPEFGENLAIEVTGDVVSHQGWVNVYKYFTDTFTWPRGLPLTELHSAPQFSRSELVKSPIQQFLADGDPDVDAIYRLLYRDPIQFERRAPVILDYGAWCPFNSQATAIFSPAFPLLYLPCFVSFRMTDIWRSLVAQAALWVHGFRVSFHQPTVEQLRNEHDLMRDFKDEVPGYLQNAEIASILNGQLEKGPGSSIGSTALGMWRALAAKDIISENEIRIAEAWFELFEAL